MQRDIIHVDRGKEGIVTIETLFYVLQRTPAMARLILVRAEDRAHVIELLVVEGYDPETLRVIGTYGLNLTSSGSVFTALWPVAADISLSGDARNIS